MPRMRFSNPFEIIYAIKVESKHKRYQQFLKVLRFEPKGWWKILKFYYKSHKLQKKICDII